jgi:hypothetical protein
MVRHPLGSILQRKASYTTVDRGAVGIIPLRMPIRKSSIGSLKFHQAPASIAGHKAQTTLVPSATKLSRVSW